MSFLMNLHDTKVALLPTETYHRQDLKIAFDNSLAALGFSCQWGTKVLLKPNLVSAGGHDGLACTHPEFVAAAAEWFIDQGAEVSIGDSPAFDSACKVMTACGITRALTGLPVTLTEFGPGRPIRLASGPTVQIARQALDCDLLVNLPRVKAHGQVLITLAVKNYFGTVLGWRKPLLHMRLGRHDDRFAAMLVDIIDHLPDSITLVDGIIAMHETGPVSGNPYSLKLVVAGRNPVAVDCALLQILKVDLPLSPVHRQCITRGLRGSLPQDLSFPLHPPAELAVNDFRLPDALQPIRFRIGHALSSVVKRLALASRQ